MNGVQDLMDALCVLVLVVGVVAAGRPAEGLLWLRLRTAKIRESAEAVRESGCSGRGAGVSPPAMVLSLSPESPRDLPVSRAILEDSITLAVGLALRKRKTQEERLVIFRTCGNRGSPKISAKQHHTNTFGPLLTFLQADTALQKHPPSRQGPTRT